MVNLHKHKGNWAKCLAEIERDKEKLVTARQGMQERIRQGTNADISKGSWFPENVNYVQGKVLWALGKYNPQIPYAKQAVDANRMKCNYFQLTPEVTLQGKPASQLLLEIAEEDAVKPVHKRRVLDLKHKEALTIPADRLGEVEEAVFLARGEKLAKDYGQWVHDVLKSSDEKNPQITFYLASPQDYDFSAGFWMHGANRSFRSIFDGGSKSLDDNYGCLSGVKKTGEASSQKILPYTQGQVRRELRRLSTLEIETEKSRRLNKKSQGDN
ncbi:MAG TPA: hypothetical protein VMZ91_01450 [Candidatus Paceibacterota bacterium]|nr:hypothetical protein [Candidatus Paceibacterota bacterium]